MNKKIISAAIGVLVLSHQLGMGSAAFARHTNFDDVNSDLLKLDSLVQADDSNGIAEMLSKNERIASLVKDALPELVQLADNKERGRKSLRDYGVTSHKKAKHEEKSEDHGKKSHDEKSDSEHDHQY